jgi:capsular exopolysaccharide synthesis family protein
VRASTDRRVRSGEQIEEALGVPVLSAIPRIKGRRKLAAKVTRAEFAPGGAAGDAYRTIRTAIYFGNRDHPIKTLVVTSAVKGEGKSTVASNLAAAMAHAGERTLLIDADLRRPSLHKAFDVDNRTGLTTILEGESQHEGLIRVTGVERLDLLPSGRIPSNPSELLSGARFAALLLQLSGEYERIVLDAPPVLGMADALVLGARCDATLLVVRADVAERRATEAAFAALVNIGARSIATVLNCVRRGHTYSRYARAYRRDDRGRYAATAPHTQQATATGVEMVGSDLRSDHVAPADTPFPADVLAVPPKDSEDEPQRVVPVMVEASEEVGRSGGLRVIDSSPGTNLAPPRQGVDERSYTRGGCNGTKVPLRRGR